MQVGDRLLHRGDAGAEVDAFEPRRDGDVALQVLAAHLGLARHVLDRRQRAERAGAARRADQQRALDRVDRRARRLRKAHADRVGAIVDDHRRRRRLALHDRRDVDLELLRREAGARRHRLIHLEQRRRAADGVLDAVEHVDDAGQLLDRLADLRRPLLQQRRILREQLDRDRLGRAGQIADHVLQQLHELDVEHRVPPASTLSRTSEMTSSDAAARGSASA